MWWSELDTHSFVSVVPLFCISTNFMYGWIVCYWVSISTKYLYTCITQWITYTKCYSKHGKFNQLSWFCCGLFTLFEHNERIFLEAQIWMLFELGFLSQSFKIHLISYQSRKLWLESKETEV